MICRRHTHRSTRQQWKNISNFPPPPAFQSYHKRSAKSCYSKIIFQSIACPSHLGPIFISRQNVPMMSALLQAVLPQLGIKNN